MGYYTFFVFLIFLFTIAVITRETFVFVLLYFFVGIFLGGNWWVAQTIKKIGFSRSFVPKAFPGEIITINLNLNNRSILPALWLHIFDSFPSEVAMGPYFEQILSLGSHQQLSLQYQVLARKRGYYLIGPSKITSGDLVGVVQEKCKEEGANTLIVYPRVLPLSSFSLPSRVPLGMLKHYQPAFEDPTRSSGKRDYRESDSLRRIDWKTSASVGRLQVKQFDPTITLETTILLDINQDDYNQRDYFEATELAIIVASSIAAWAVQKKQAVGLIINALDPFSSNEIPPVIPVHKGRSHLMLILETLARIKLTKNSPFIPFFQPHWKHLRWGTTVVLITGHANQELFENMVQVQRLGLNPVLILCGSITNLAETSSYAKILGIPFFSFVNESDLGIWQK